MKSLILSQNIEEERGEKREKSIEVQGKNLGRDQTKDAFIILLALILFPGPHCTVFS